MADKKGNWFKEHKIITAILVVIAIAVVASATGSDNSSTQPNQQSSQQPSPEPATTSEEEKPDVPAEYKSALAKADSYANIQHLSKKGLYDQLTSQYGEQFTKKAAQYAIDNVDADWKANALAKAKEYQETQNMSPAAIHDQLTSQYGEQFTKAEADYAIQHLND